MTHKHALPIPPQVTSAPDDDNVIEVVRAWINRGPPAIYVRPAFDDPRAMGRMLAEICWHFADAYQEVRGVNQQEALAALKEGWAEGHRHAESIEMQRRAQ